MSIKNKLERKLILEDKNNTWIKIDYEDIILFFYVQSIFHWIKIFSHYCPVNNSILSVSYKRECKQFVNLANKY